MKPDADQRRENGKQFTVLSLFPGENTAHFAGPLRASQQVEGGAGNRARPFLSGFHRKQRVRQSKQV